MNIKPKKAPFIAYNLLTRFVIGLFLILVLYVAYQVNLVLSFVILLAFLVLSYFTGTISYRKEEYTIKDNKVIRNSGGIFSDAEQELNIKNITHLEFKESYIDRKFFGVGSVIIESAGSQAAEVSISSVENPREIFQLMQDKMKQAGFKINRDEILEEDTPSKIAIFLDIASASFGSFFLIIALTVWSPLAAVPLGFLIIFLLVMRYYDWRSHKYTLFQGKIVEKSDFLSEVHTIVPIENLSDSNLEQNFFDRILGLYDLKLSCQGSGSEIKFKNIEKGESFDDKIDKLIKSQEAVSLQTDQEQKSEAETEKQDKKSRDKTKARGLGSIPNEFQSFKKDFYKAILTPVIIVLAILALFSVLSAGIWALSSFLGGVLYLFNVLGFLSSPALLLVIAAAAPSTSELFRYFATDYSVKERSIRSEYSLFKTDIKEFSDDKITGIYFKESLLDRIFGTYTIHFWSVGSGDDIEFSGIKKSKQLEQILEKKYNFDIKSESHSTTPEFSFSKMLKQKTNLLAIAGAFFIVLAVVSVLISAQIDNYAAILGVFIALLLLFVVFLVGMYIYKSYYYDRAYLSFFSDFLISKQGLINKYQYFVNYNDIKGIVTTKYPWTSSGEIKFKVSGEQKANKQYLTNPSNKLSLEFIINIPAKDELIDLVLEQKQDFRQMGEIEQNIDKYRKKDVTTSGPDLANTLTPVLVLSVIFFPLIALLPITVPIVVWQNKRKSYHLKPYRVLKKSGILFRKQHSIVFRKIDHINKSQGFLNKMFSNGNISINTLASGGTEMTLENLSDYEEFYKKIQEIY